MGYAIVERELLGTMRTGRAFALQVATSIAFAVLIVSRWPGNATVELSGAQAREVFRLFAYGLLAILLLLVPAFPATSIVNERKRGTLALLLTSPLPAWSVYAGKALGTLLFASLLLALSVPAATAAYAMGGISFTAEVLPLYAILGAVLVQYTALAMLASSCANSTDAALRSAYGLVLLLALVSLGPHYFLQGKPGVLPQIAEWLRCVSPVPAVMELAGHGDVGAFGLGAAAGTPGRFLIFAGVSIAACAVLTIARLNAFLLDRPRPQGIVTDDRSAAERWFRRCVFLVDPQRRKRGIGPLANPVMVKEFRTRRFGRFHWLLRLVAVSAIVSLLLTYAATSGTIDWGVETIGGMMVVLQVALIIVLTPSLGASLISAERESGGWELLRMTPLTAASILSGKLASVLSTLLLLMLATLPGYLVMIWIHPPLRWQVWQALICLGWMALLAMLLSAAVGSLCRRTAVATVVSYGLLGAGCLGTMLFWLGRGTSFSHSTVQSVLTVNPMAAALTIIAAPGFTAYTLAPANWWWMGGLCLACSAVLLVQTWRLTRPQ
ncbi:MAG: ABC transporter permease [Pirellulales bacterium]|jgi:ABC-type transport system involved in multi-copper enzyme maturation permease subunit|nr:ABC transporter permease [Thermoguttaceae bacterium]MDD4788473.1 ABC transporter permease [Pirellulales bacterium]MDI9443919.1 ABC transporter permease [Planctomycetota bacterium]NLZ01888.1 ABC transporter permease subunit [Pirellulaceae bacterium]